MLEHGRISALQMGMMIYSSIVTTSILYLPASTYNYAGKDLWLSPIPSAILSVMIVCLLYKLHDLYPRASIIQYSCSIVGRIGGKLIGAILLLFILFLSNQALWQYGEFVSSYFLPLTPQVVILGTISFASALAVYGGVEVMGRLSDLLTPLLLFMFLIILILLLPDIRGKNMLPIFANGVTPILKGSYFSNLWFCESLFITFFLPFLKNLEKGRKWGIVSVFFLLFTVMSMNLVALLVLGNATGSFDAPLMNAVQYINIADFLSHLEAIVMAAWIAGAFIKMYVFYYVLALGTAQWFNLSDYRPLVFPIAFLSVVLAIWQVPDVIAFRVYVQTVNSVVGPLLFIMIPLFLLLIAFLRKNKQNEKRVEQQQ
ncbi:endospore germination permease [Peribacillus asahii]|uniref:GerAB/ArcD/ProY family transporter n=1 Tax=Peribacillus asahii TaxID=228899 RepID=UPI00382C1E90